jgi:hypothetical protein
MEVCIATSYGLSDRAVGVEARLGQELSLLHVLHTGCGAHPAFCPIGTGGSFPGDKASGA